MPSLPKAKFEPLSGFWHGCRSENYQRRIDHLEERLGPLRRFLKYCRYEPSNQRSIQNGLCIRAGECPGLKRQPPG